MRTLKALGFGLLAVTLACPARAAEPGAIALGPAPEQQAIAAVPSEDERPASAVIDTGAPPEVAPPPPSGLALALRQIMSELNADPSERELEVRAAIASFYDARSGAPVWITDKVLNARALALTTEIAAAGDYGLTPADFILPKPTLGNTASDELLVRTELAYAVAAMKYADHARGGRIMHPSADLSSYLDRAPQLLDPRKTLTELATSADVGTTLRGLHPQHSQFEKLRQKYLAVRGKGTGKHLSSDAKRLLANMEQWRWMPTDMGDFYVWNNIPEYTQRVMENGSLIHTERIVAGLISKQTPIFSRPMRKIVFRPKWKVPESIKVREVWPSLLRGGGIMAEHGLRIETKEGVQVPIHSVNWATSDIRNYEVYQPPGPHSVLGNIKFSFPNQHTVFMHDTQDKHLFAASQRTYSHGCMRVRNPAKLAEVILHADKGWDAAQITDLIKTGPLDNEVMLVRKVPVHITYFTALVGEDGKLATFRDVYGHERRITQALDGRWNEIDKGRDHLAPVEPDRAIAMVQPNAMPTSTMRVMPARTRTVATKQADFLGQLFGF